MNTRHTATTTIHCRITPTAYLQGSASGSFIITTFIVVLSTVLPVAGAFLAISLVVVSMVLSMVLGSMQRQVFTTGIGNALLG